MSEKVLREFRPEDYEAINRRNFDMMTYLEFPNVKTVSKNLGRGPAFTGLVDGEVIACGGVIKLWKGVGEAWLITSPLVEKYPLFFVGTVLKKLKELATSMKLERIQIAVDKGHRKSKKWVKWMGFEREGLMRRYVGGRDFIRYAIIREVKD